MHTGCVTPTWEPWKQTNFSDNVTAVFRSLKVWADLEGSSTWLSTCRSIKFTLCPSLWFLSLWMNIYCRTPVCEAEMTYAKVSIPFLHLQPQLISSHSVDLLATAVALVVRTSGLGRRGLRWQSKIRLVLMTLILGPFFICQSTRMALHVSLSQFICLLSYLPHERPRQPTIRRRMIIVSAFPGKCR